MLSEEARVVAERAPPMKGVKCIDRTGVARHGDGEWIGRNRTRKRRTLKERIVVHERLYDLIQMTGDFVRRGVGNLIAICLDDVDAIVVV